MKNSKTPPICPAPSNVNVNLVQLFVKHEVAYAKVISISFSWPKSSSSSSSTHAFVSTAMTGRVDAAKGNVEEVFNSGLRAATILSDGSALGGLGSNAGRTGELSKVI